MLESCVRDTLNLTAEGESPQPETTKGEIEKDAGEEVKKDNDSTSQANKKDNLDDKQQEVDSSKSHHGQKRPSSRGGRSDMRGPSTRGYTMYRGGNSWSRRGGSGSIRMGRNYSEHWSDSENSEDVEDDYGGRRSERSPKVPRKDRDNKGDSGSRSSHLISSKDGFAPRGEPSRRGRGGSSSSSASSFRRGAMSGPKRMDSYSSSGSKSSFGGSNTSGNLNDDKNEKHASERKSELLSDDKTKLNQMALSAGLNARKSSECNDDSTKGRDKGSQPKLQRDDKKSPPKQFSGQHYQSQVSRKDSTGSKNDTSNVSSANILRKDDESSGKKDGLIDAERKKSVSKEKEMMHDVPKQQRSNSSGHISSVRGSSHVKKDDRSSQKPITKPPPGLGFKQNPSLGQPGHMQANQQHKEQPLAKSKSSGDNRIDNRTTTTKPSLPPRLAKQWETRTKREGNLSDSSGGNQHQTSSNAWEKPLQQPQDLDKIQMQQDNKDFSHLAHQQQIGPSGVDQKSNSGQKNDPNSTKSVLDSSSAPVNTIIFENTNYKTVQAPLKRQLSNQCDSSQGNQKKSDEIYKSQNNSSIQDMQHINTVQQQQIQQQASQRDQSQLQQQQSVVHQVQQHQQQQAHNQQQEAITTALSQMAFAKADNDYDKDMKLGFPFDTEFSHLTEDKSSSSGNKPGLCLPRSSSVIHSSSASQNTISPSTADLNMKIASVKKVWENVSPMPTVLEHTGVAPNDTESHLNSNFVTSQHQQHLQHFAAAAVAAHAAHSGNIHMQHALSSPGPPSYGNTFDPTLEPHFGNKDASMVGNSSSNAPESEPGGYSPSPQHAVGSQSQHQSNTQSNLALKHAAEALSSNNGNVCKVKASQQQMHQSSLGLSPPPAMQQGTTQLHQAPQPFYQPSQFGAMPTIPSPPVLYNSSPMPSYGPFQIEAGRSQFSQYPGHYGTAGSGPYSAYMQTPPNMPTAPAPDMYPSLTSQFRMGGAVQTPFNQSQQLNNPSTVLISSSSNSLMSASVKPSSQQIGAIGSKSNAAAVAAAASVGQPYGQQYMNLYPPQQAPPQLQSNSYYSNSAGGQGAFFGGPTAAGATQSYGLQAAAGIFGGHGGPQPSSAPPQQQIANFSSQYINSPLLTAAAINQFRGGHNPQTTAYMKSNQGQNHMQDSMGRQLKSPLGTDVSLNLAKQVQSQQSPPHHKNYAPSWDLQNQVLQQQQQSQNPQNRTGNGPNNINTGRPGQGAQRYPAPIQRPTNYPSHQSSSQQQSQRSVRQPHSGPGGPINKHYYGNSAGASSRGGHSSNPVDQVKQSVDKNIDSTSSQQDISVKEDNSND